MIEAADTLSVGTYEGVLKNQTSGATPKAKALPPNIQLQRVLKSGGRVEVTKEKLARQAAV